MQNTTKTESVAKRIQSLGFSKISEQAIAKLETDFSAAYEKSRQPLLAKHAKQLAAARQKCLLREVTLEAVIEAIRSDAVARAQETATDHATEKTSAPPPLPTNQEALA